MDNKNKYYQSRHFQRLLRRYEKAVSEGQVPYMEADELTDIAEYYMTGKQDEKANQAIQAAIDMHPDSVDPQVFVARQKMFYGQFDEARAIIDNITEQDDLEVIYIRAELLIKEGHADEASDFLLQQMDMMQDSLDDFLYDCTSIFMDYDCWEQAEEWRQRLCETFPDHPRMLIMEAEILMGLDYYEDALPMLKEILDEDPYNSEAWNLLAETYVAMEKCTEALEAADYALAINPQDTTALLMKGNAYMQNEQMSLAIDCYSRYLETQPDDLSVQISRCICYTNEERYREVLPLLEKAEQYANQLPDRGDDLPQILQMRAFSLSRLGRIPEALAAIKQARECCDETLSWKFDITEADIHLQTGQMRKAEKYFAQALSKSPEQSDTLFNIALIYSGAGYYDIAIDLLNDVWTIFGIKEGKFVVPYLANCYLHKFREIPEHQPERKRNMERFLEYLKLAPFCDRDATISLFRDRFPGIPPEDYYAYAFKEAYGVFPPKDSDLE